MTSKESNEPVIWSAPPAGANRGRRGVDVTDFVRALRTKPGEWGRLPGEFSSLPTAAKNTPDVQWQVVRIKDGDGNPSNRVEVYGRYLELPSEDLAHQTTGHPPTPPTPAPTNTTAVPSAQETS